MKTAKIDLNIQVKLRTAGEGASTALAGALQAVAQALANAAGPVTPAVAACFDFVFAPGHPAPRPANVFTDWKALVDAAGGVGGVPCVTVDDRFAPAVIPAGTWAFAARPVLRGDPGRAGSDIEALARLEFADGARLAGVRVFRDLNVRSVSSTPVITTPAGEAAVYQLQGWAWVQAAGTAPFIQHDVPEPCSLIVDDNGSALAGMAPVLRVGVPGEPVHVLTWKSGLVEPNTISGVAGRVYGGRIAQPDGYIDATQDVPAFPVAVGAQDPYIQHVPRDAGTWATPPSSVHEAIERLAEAFLARTGGAPIP